MGPIAIFQAATLSLRMNRVLQYLSTFISLTLLADGLDILCETWKLWNHQISLERFDNQRQVFRSASERWNIHVTDMGNIQVKYFILDLIAILMSHKRCSYSKGGILRKKRLVHIKPFTEILVNRIHNMEVRLMSF